MAGPGGAKLSAFATVGPTTSIVHFVFRKTAPVLPITFHGAGWCTIIRFFIYQHRHRITGHVALRVVVHGNMCKGALSAFLSRRLFGNRFCLACVGKWTCHTIRGGFPGLLAGKKRENGGGPLLRGAVYFSLDEVGFTGHAGGSRSILRVFPMPRGLPGKILSGIAGRAVVCRSPRKPFGVSPW